MASEPSQETSTSTADAMDARERVFAEAKRFRTALPSLLPTHGGRWIVFRDGQVASVHASQEEAYVAGLERFGLYGGHVVAEVRESEIIYVSAAAALGL